MTTLIAQFPEYKQLLGTLTHKKFHALLKKIKRKLKRQAAAILQQKNEQQELLKLQNCPEFLKSKAEKEREDKINEEFEEFNRKKKQEAWLQRESAAQAEFIRLKELKIQMKLKREEQEKLIKEEWESQQAEERKIKEEQENKSKEKEKLLAEATASLAKEGETPWHNPIVGMETVNGEQHGTEKDRENCPFFVKTGACRFGDRCSRHHAKPNSSRTILIPSMYSHFSIEQSFHDEFDTDISLEYEDKDTYLHFREFYDDVLPEFKAIGPLLQFKVCCNYEPHLRGNVYVQYESEADALQAYTAFNGRWYGGRQLSCQFTNVVKWRSAICGLFGKKCCPKGKNCNFLHVFTNPDVFSGDYDDYIEYSQRRTGDKRAHSSFRHRSERSEKRSYRSYDHSSSRSTKQGSRSPSRSHRSSRSSRSSSKNLELPSRKLKSLKSSTSPHKKHKKSSRKHRKSSKHSKSSRNHKSRSSDTSRRRSKSSHSPSPVDESSSSTSSSSPESGNHRAYPSRHCSSPNSSKSFKSPESVKNNVNSSSD